MKKSRYLQPDGTIKTSSTPRIEGTLLYFTGSGDDVVNGIIGEGTPIFLDNTVITEPTNSVECEFMDDIHLKDGMIMWENAIMGDEVSWENILPAGVPMPAENGKGNADLINDVVEYITASQIPDETWVGDYYLFPMDYVVNRFVNKLRLLGSNTKGLILESEDAMLIPNIFKHKLTYKNVLGTINVNFRLVASIEMYRDRTVYIELKEEDFSDV